MFSKFGPANIEYALKRAREILGSQQGPADPERVAEVRREKEGGGVLVREV